MEPEPAAQKQPRPRRRSRRASVLSEERAAGLPADTPGPAANERCSLRRGSSFTFLTPGPHWDFTLKRKRREKDDDVVSLSSLDLKEPSNKRVRPLARVTSLANLISPVRNGAVRRFGQTIQSFTLRGDHRSPASTQKSFSRSTLKEILRHTPKDHLDVQLLEEAILIIQGVLSDINLKKGESECQYYIDKLEYLDEKQKDPRIEASKVLLCHGELKNKSGHKLYIFLFQDILVLTRPVTRNERHSYQVYRQPIPVQELVLEDLQDGDVRMGGSFRGAFGNSDKAKNIFRVRFQDPSPGQSHTLQANDVFHKQQAQHSGIAPGLSDEFLVCHNRREQLLALQDEKCIVGDDRRVSDW
ncbi:neuroepithelial cell-transforming gene 1 protein [Mastomys coucha]|uniref:neuroepithelial cell-transforming gene 1 protein n=1 Tax=Mastomys coucha TaxID=35658 RepID=UPI0012625C82|nr:neuroepithelial cell-transforming gene 1 protein [Mastomys coucha]